MKYIIISFIVILFVYGRYVEPDAVKIREIHMNSEFITKALEDKIIVHISDLHISRFGKVEIRVLRHIEKIKPDLIFLTGDYVAWRGDIQPALKFFSRLTAKLGVFAVMGDYDYSDSKNSCLFCHEKGTGKPTRAHSVQMLINSSQKIIIGNQAIKVVGIDEGYDDLNGVLEIKDLADPELLSLVLSHSPLAFDKFSDKDKIFIFSGDTHGGQVKLPKWVFNVLGYEKNVKYNYGLFKEGNKTLYVNRGIGTSHLKFRLFCPPEIAVFRF